MVRASAASSGCWRSSASPYQFVPVKLRSREAYALNPSGKVPILTDGDVRITDSAAICVYLADKHADKGMGASPGLAGRAEMDLCMHFAQLEFEAPLWNKLRHRFLLPEAVRVDVGPAAAHDFASEVKALETRLDGKRVRARRTLQRRRRDVGRHGCLGARREFSRSNPTA